MSLDVFVLPFISKFLFGVPGLCCPRGRFHGHFVRSSVHAPHLEQYGCEHEKHDEFSLSLPGLEATQVLGAHGGQLSGMSPVGATNGQ